MKADIQKLLKMVDKTIRECRRYEKLAGREGRYVDAIKLVGMVDAFKRTSWDLKQILKNAKNAKSL